MMKMSRNARDPVLVIGWREWISLPTLHLPYIKAKVDTGAKTSSLHAFDIYETSERGERRVHFSVHPVQKRDDIIVRCSAQMVDHRVLATLVATEKNDMSSPCP
jgi:hypothetical protein